MEKIRTVFMGSPEFAIPSLQRLIQDCKVTGVITQPDRPSGRGKKLTPPPVKLLAEKHGIEVIQPQRMKDPGVHEKLEAWLPELIVVAAFGQILKPWVLDLPRYGCLNVHGSLLPRWRGAAPIQAAILAGDTETGVTLMKMDAGIDTGALLASQAVPISAQDTADALTEILAQIGADLLMETMPGYLSGEITPSPQDEKRATYAGMIHKEEGILDFSEPAELLERKVRAYQPWPMAKLISEQTSLGILKAFVLKGVAVKVGERCIYQKYPAIGTADGLLVLEEVQPAGKKRMSGRDFLNGITFWGEKCETDQ